MDKRKIYIITTLIVLALLATLALWYSYIVKQEIKITQTSDISMPTDILSNRQVDTTNIKTLDDTITYGAHHSVASSTASSTIAIAPDDTTNETIAPVNWVLTQLYKNPVVDVLTSTTTVTYIDKKTGIINSAGIPSLTTGSSTVTVLKDVEKTYLLPNNHILIIPKIALPYITKYSGTTVATTTNIISDEIYEVAHNDTAIYYITNKTNGGISVNKIKYKNIDSDPIITKEIWSSPLTNWVLSSSDSKIYVTQKASDGVPGYSYLISDSSNKPLQQDKPGLITNLSPDSTKLLYSTANNSNISLYLKDVDSGDEEELYITTLANKCVWGNDSIILYCAIPAYIPNNMPDSWYKGKVHLKDSMWRIDTTTGASAEIIPTSDIDMVNLHIVDDTLLFKNKADQSLWTIHKE